MPKHSLVGLISQCHREIREIFLLHQEALILGNFKQAIILFESHKVCHEIHKNFEDENLIPVFSKLPEKGNWPVSVYEKEHEKITQWLDRLEEDLKMLSKLELDKRQKRHNIIALLDREKSFKGLCEHHEEREEDAMLLALDEQTEQGWRERVILPFRDKWDELLTGQKKIIKNIVATWEVA